MAGINNEIGYGQAQVLPKGASLNEFVQQLNEQKALKEQRDFQKQKYQYERDKDLYDIIGTEFNPKNFNSVIHDKVRQSAAELAAKIKQGGLSYGDTYVAAMQKAGELSQISDQFNNIDAQLDKTRTEYEKYDKGLNTSAIEFQARKNVLDQYRSGKPIDQNKNWFDEALTNMTDNALNYKGSQAVNFTPEEKKHLTGKFRERNKVGVTNEFDWDTETVPAIYNIKDNGENKAPDVSIKSESSGLKDEKGNDIPMLAEDAYKRYALLPSKRKELDIAITKKYGDIPLDSPQAERLRRIEAYNEAEINKPVINKKRVEMQPVPHISINTGKGELTINDVYKGISDATDKADIHIPGSNLKGTRMNTINADAQKIILDYIGDKTLDQSNTFLVKDQGDIKVYKTDTNGYPKIDNEHLITTLPKTGVNLKGQPSVKEKREVIKEGSQYKYKGKTYTESQLQAAAKASGMTVEEYKKELGL